MSSTKTNSASMYDTCTIARIVLSHWRIQGLETCILYSMNVQAWDWDQYTLLCT